MQRQSKSPQKQQHPTHPTSSHQTALESIPFEDIERYQNVIPELLSKIK